jgi:membrane-associated phospholipid phosphatase
MDAPMAIAINEAAIRRPSVTTTRPNRATIGAPIVLALLAAAALSIDLPLSRLCRHGDLPGDVVRLVNLSEVFAHGAGVAMILLTAWALDPLRRRQLALVAAGAYGAGLLANIVKLFVARSRPHAFGDGDAVLDTFQAWLPFLPGRLTAPWSHSVQGFPSAHAATAFGLAIGLSALYPRGRWLFFGFACLASFQRVAAGAHFLSDVLAGAALGCLVAAVIRAKTHSA